MPPLSDRISAVLGASAKPMSASELVGALNANGGAIVNRREVNRCLRGEMRDQVTQDSSYRWNLRDSGSSTGPERPAQNPRQSRGEARTAEWAWFKRLVSYYLDCLLENEGHAARYFLNEVGRKYLSLALETEWCLSERGELRVELTEELAPFGRELRQRQATAVLFYGYPLYVDWRERTRSGWTGGFAVPVFLQSVEYTLNGTTLTLRLISEWPRLNSEFVSTVGMSPEEKRLFIESLGFGSGDAEPPEDGLADIVARMAETGEWIPLAEPLDPESLPSEPALASIDRGGLYNRAVIVVGERSAYTRGLERELPLLREQVPQTKLATSALRLFIRRLQEDVETEEDLGAVDKRPGTDDSSKETGRATQPIVEVVPLNDEQRAAIQSAFSNDLTVVTGPPGTGKSQVVASVLANAWLRGERVLFTSYNNKAVDVVEARINALSDHPLLIRTGRRAGGRDLRAELLGFLSRLLSVSVIEDDRLVEVEARKAVTRLADERVALWQRLEELRVSRNAVDRQDQVVQAHRDDFDSAVWKLLWNTGGISSPDGLDEVIRLTDAHTAGGGWFRRLALLARRRSDFQNVARAVAELRETGDLLGVPPASSIEKSNIGAWRAYLLEASRRIEAIGSIAEYRRLLNRLEDDATPARFADELSHIEESLWEWGEQYIAAHGRVLSDRLDDSTRRALGEYRATLERLAGDRIGGRAYAQLMREQGALFARVSSVIPAWCVTNLSASGSLPLESGIFDLVVVDEASQCDIPSALPLLYRAKRAMIIGDPNQLRHISTVDRARDQQLQNKHELTHVADQPYTYGTNSLFDLAAMCVDRGAIVSLREHFRSHADIVGFSNRKWYDGRLTVCTDYRRLATVDGDHRGIRWTDVKGKVIKPSAGSGALNQEEAAAVVVEVEKLLVEQSFQGTVGIVTPFRAQANRIRDLITQRLDLSVLDRAQLITDTANGFQGDERDVIFFSPCMGTDMPRGAKWFLGATGNLFNVAITRARSLLHVVGDIGVCGACEIPHVQEFAAYVGNVLSKSPQMPKSSLFIEGASVGFWERPFFDALVAAGLKPMHQYPEHQYCLDFAIKEGELWLDVEIDGELYHKEWDGTRSRKDVIRDLRLTALGWTVKRFWVYQVRDEMAKCVDDVLTLTELSKQGVVA